MKLFVSLFTQERSAENRLPRCRDLFLQRTTSPFSTKRKLERLRHYLELTHNSTLQPRPVRGNRKEFSSRWEQETRHFFKVTFPKEKLSFRKASGLRGLIYTQINNTFSKDTDFPNWIKTRKRLPAITHRLCFLHVCVFFLFFFLISQLFSSSL